MSLNPDSVLNAIAFVAERKIEEAAAEGAFDDLPGAGAPLRMEDLSHLPPEMRTAYMLLRNAGYLEKAIPAGRHVNMSDLLAGAPEEKDMYGKMRRLKVLTARVRREEAKLLPETAGKTKADPEDSPYLEKIMERI
ncbi:MAG: DUF1992 domain-containing protein [Desulfovibrio sp.]|jgi:hypothetical protein|nr:DUF1992 domain-containing protein [Desulfovibrio sp.]